MIRRTKKATIETHPGDQAILTADWHLRESIPVCRTDNFIATQWAKVLYISELQKQLQCPVIHAGDLFDHWKPSPYLLSCAIQNLPDQFYTIYGNHDLPQHSLELAEKSGLYTLLQTDRIQLLNGSHWGLPAKQIVIPGIKRPIVIWHVMTWQGKVPWPGCPDPEAKTLLENTKGPCLILTGHNHKTFKEESKSGRILLNPGSLTRQAADQIDHRPSVFIWRISTNSLTQIFLPIETGVISRAHIDVKQNRDNRIAAFIEKLGEDWEIGASFETNLAKHSSNIPSEVKRIIRKALDNAAN